MKAARADAARAVALERIAASVPYADAIKNVEADVHKPTAATEAHRAENRLPDDKTGYTSGLSDARVFADVRFKVACALREAGVARTAAAQSTIANLVGPRAVNPITGQRG